MKGLRLPLVLLLFLLPALLPLLRLDRLPCTHDGPFHVYRFVVVGDMLRHGVLFSRWVPQLALGHGYPFFNYREPLPYLAGGALYALGVPVTLIVGLFYVGAALAAAWGAFVVARDWVGEPGAWIAALAYGLGPYLLLDSLRRGNLPESLALGMVPWCLVAFRRLIERGKLRHFGACVGLLAALFLTHNITSLLLAPFLGGYVVLLAWEHRRQRAWPWAFVAAGLAVLLTAWFWLPALAEQGYAQLHLSRTTRNNDFHYNFVSWAELLFTLPAPYDPAYLNPPMRVALGVAQWALGLVGLVVGLVSSRQRLERLLLLYFAGVAAAYAWMGTLAAVGVWEGFPALSFVQFPWRMVGRALLPVSLLAAWAIPPRWRQSLRRGGLPVAAALIAIVGLAWPESYPPKGVCAAEPAPDLADVYAYEQQGWMGIDPESSYFPIWVERHPSDATLAEAFARGEIPERLDPGSLPAGATVLESDPGMLTQRVTVRTPEPFEARWKLLYFPGWSVEVDGQPVEVAPEDETGFLLARVPAGEHALVVRFGPTPLRAWASGASGAALLLGLALVVGFQPLTRRWRGAALSLPAPEAEPAPKVLPWLALAAVVAAGLLVIKVGWIDRGSTLVRHSRLAADELPEVEQSLVQPYADGLQLLGYSLPAVSLAGDGELEVDLLWQATETPSQEYRVSVLLFGPDGQAWSPAGTLRPRGYEPTPPTTMWQPGQYAYDPHIVTPLAGTPPGEYDVVVSVFSRAGLVPLSLLDGSGAPLGPELRLGTVVVGPPAAPASLEALGVSAKDELAACGTLGLWRATLDRQAAAPGELLAVETVWEALGDPLSALSMELMLVDEAGGVVKAGDLPPVAAWWSTERWRVGERWAGRHLLRLPGSLESGAYRFELRLTGCEEALAALPIEVIAPERVWEVPSNLAPLDVVLGEQVRLAGVELEGGQPAGGDTLTVRLAWQAVAEMEISYRVYLHLVDATGRVVAQHDGEPAEWTRPTTGWAAGEVVVEERRLTVPEGATGLYRVRMGLYEVNGARLLTAEGDDGVTVGELYLP